MKENSAIYQLLQRFTSAMGLERFDHRRAQKYELRFSENWIKENFESLYARLKEAKAQGERWPGPLELVVKEFFAGCLRDWGEFAALVEGKTCLEIGGGPCGALAIWWWIKRRIIVDPLVQQYKQISLQLFERSWYTDDLELYAQPAERFIPELSSAIDGAVICRNMLGHSERPMLVLENIAAYAKPGCYLLLWTDLWHLKGHNEGHRNITKDRKGFERKIKDLGFEILYSFNGARQDGSTIDYGCRARKRVMENQK